MEKSAKNDIRIFVKEQRMALETTAECVWNDSICRQLLSIDDILRAFCVYCYVSFRREAGTWRFMPGILPLLLTLAVWYLMDKKKWSATKIILGITGFAAVMVFLKIM